ncbi:glycosyltransferase family 25 protein [Rhizobium leguminosarum]|nr:glycosyltransferase family 25 protein [Rhizobium leguminosarum]MBY2936171.1 glycosyltransferase family 25 protein [Rhizobium leguminosarum]
MSASNFGGSPPSTAASFFFPTPDYDERRYRLRHGKRTNPAEVGCYLSHIECAKCFLESSADHALILEDDVEFPPDLCELLLGALDARDSWDILRLSTVNTGRKYSFQRFTTERSLAIALTREKGSGAYMINRQAAEWLVGRMVPMCLPYNLAFNLEYLASLRSVFVSPVPINQCTNFPTQIQLGLRSYRIAGWRRLPVFLFRAWIEASRFSRGPFGCCGRAATDKILMMCRNAR